MKILKALVFACLLLAAPLVADAKIFLADTDDTLRVVTASGVSTIHMYAAWADITTTALTPGASDAQVTTATTTVLVAAPGASTQRQIKGLTVANSHASSSNVVTVEFFDGATATRLIAYTLLAGETLQWAEDVGFRVLDASGQLKGAVVADTEMPAAQSLSGNNIAYPTSAPLVGAVLLCDDGAALDKCQGGLTDTDDGSIARSQVPSLVVAQQYVDDGVTWVRSFADPCARGAKTFLPINISTATTTEITPSLAGASTHYYVCSLVLVTNATNIVTLVDDDSDGCGSPTSGLSGGTTTAGWTFAANGGLTFGNGASSVFKTGGTNRVVCLVTSAATQLSGTMTVVAAP